MKHVEMFFPNKLVIKSIIKNHLGNFYFISRNSVAKTPGLVAQILELVVIFSNLQSNPIIRQSLGTTTYSCLYVGIISSPP